jgi:uncharacterized protein YwqG
LRYFVPTLKLSADLTPQEKLEDKLGGLPWGLKTEQYPICRHCGKSQSLLAQFVHNPERLDLGKSGRALFVFQCNYDPGGCPTWEGGSGANACFVLDPDELSGKLTPMPTDSPRIEPEAHVLEWLPHDDEISSSEVFAFYDEQLHNNLSDETLDGIYTGTKLGSVPEWVQSSSEAPEGWTFIGQLSDSYELLQETYPSLENSACNGPNFGDAGIGYIFLRYQSGKPDGWFFWQCG